MAGWQDAPIVGTADTGKKAAWESAPVIGAAPASGLDKLPPETPQARPQPTQNNEGIGQRILGAGEAGLALGTGALGGAAGQLYGIGKTLTGGKYGTQQGAQEGERAGVELANKLTYQPRTQTGRDIVGGIGSALEASRLQGLPVEGAMLNRIPEVPGAALRAGEGAAATVGKGAKAAGNVAAKALPAVDPETAQLAREAHNMGFRLTPDQVIGGKYAKALGEGAASVPLSGSNLKHNREVFTQNINDLAGVEGSKMTRKAVDDAYKKWGKQEIGGINAKYDVPMDKAAFQALKSHAAGELPEVAGVVNHYASKAQKVAVNGVIPGKVFRKLNTDLDTRIRTTSNGDLKNALSNLQDDLLDRQQAAISDPVDLQRLATARRHYAILKTVEPLVAKSPTGEITPSSLLGVLTATKAGKARVARGAAGDLGKLADIGQRFLKEQPSSGTAERRWAQALPSTLGGLAGGTAGAAGAGLGAAAGVAGTVGAANLYNRFGPALTQRMIERPPQ
jgi:hypothetical protein